MDQVILGVNNKKKFISLSNYALTTQIVIINLTTALVVLFFLFFFNIFFLLNNNQNIENQKIVINNKLNQITSYLNKNAIKRILTFDDSCNKISEGTNRESARIICNENKLLDKNYEDKLPQLDPTYTQKYIYSNFLDTFLNVRVIADNLIKFADTNDVFGVTDKVLISDIDIDVKNLTKENNSYENINFYKLYKKFYFNIFNKLKENFDKKKLNNNEIKKIKNDNIIVMEIIKNKLSQSYVYKDQENNFKNIFASPVLKDDKVYGVVIIDSPVDFKDIQGASQSILLTNFYLFFISIMFLLSLYFSKSIVGPIKILSQITNLERDKIIKNKNKIIYLNRKDEIGKLSEDIKSMSSNLKKRIREIEEFASDVSHELKNPLAGLKSSSDLLISSNLNKNKEELLIKNMKVDIDRMNILISDIANYSLTQVEISEEAFEEIEIINFLFNFKKSLQKNNFDLDVQNQDKQINLKINKNKLLQVLHNLLDNSLSYIKNKSNILITVKSKQNFCIIHFVDQGQGISLEYKDKIFERFYTDRAYDRKSHSGLGLSISKKIIESFGGTINLIKSPYLSFQGACFEIKLPLKDL